jgi:hypothetical protein
MTRRVLPEAYSAPAKVGGHFCNVLLNYYNDCIVGTDVSSSEEGRAIYAGAASIATIESGIGRAGNQT